MQIQSILGHNNFPGSPLFCQYGQHYGLVGIESSHKPGYNAGNEIYIKKGKSKNVKIENYRATTLKWGTLHDWLLRENSPDFFKPYETEAKLFPHEVLHW